MGVGPGSVLASAIVIGTGRETGRGLLVLADGAQGAFAAGAVAELARRGAVWARGAGGGLGAQIGVLALLGEAAEAERRWLRDGELGSPLLRSRLAAYRERVAATPGAVLMADPWTLDGWLDPGALAEHLEPELAGLPARLSRLHRSFAAAIEDVSAGAAAWVELTGVSPEAAGDLVRAAATFPAGWGPAVTGADEASRRLWGGVGAALACPPPWAGAGGGWDVVCGFPAPTAQRTALGGSLLELIQRREEARAGFLVGEWLAGEAGGTLRVIAPAPATYAAWAGRENADLGVEYPLPWERNGALSAGMVRYGAFAVGG